MSFILDALKKSDQERNRGRAPDLQSLHGNAPQASKPRRWWPYAVVAALLVNVALLFIWMQEQNTAKTPAPAVAAAPPRPMVTPPAPLPVQAAPAAPQPTSMPAVPATPLTATPLTESPPSAAPQQNSQQNHIVAFSDLPPEVRRGIPEMSFAVHLYSAKPAERMVSINGKMLKEGQEVSPGLKLLEITADGTVFGYQGYTFKRAVF